jgi:xanthine/CO dehydrogenase XdhC/CoxF family maturation factor
MREIGDIVQAFECNPHERFALATLVRTRGSSYRRPGARMLIGGDGRAVGSLSGGCLEEEVVDRAREVIRTGEPAWMQFDTRRRFGCHGEIEIFVERACPAFLADVARCFHARRSFVVATAFSRDAAAAGSRIAVEPECQSPETFVQKMVPPVQLLVIGEGPDSAALRGFAHTLGWPVIAVESATELGDSYDEWTAAVVKTHNYGRDFAALRALLPLGLRYVGLLGPRRRREQLLGDLLDTGLEVGKNLFGPAGLDLGGDSPEAIALAIVAEIQSVFSGGSRQELRERREPIHGFSQSDLAVAD